MPVDEACQQFKVSRNTIWRLHKAGLLPLYKEVGVRATLVRPRELQEALKTRKGPGRPRKTEE